LKGTFRVNKEQLEIKAKHISLQERRATDAERESVKYKQVEYIQGHVGEEFDGVISGMIDRGIFVKLQDSLVEGMVTFDRMDESFELADSRLKAFGKKSKRVVSMGDKVRVRIVSADLDTKQVEMSFVE